MSQPPTLTPQIVQELLDPRLLLEKGMKFAQLFGPADLHFGLIALDGANERAMGIAATHYHVRIGKDFEDDMSKVVQELRNDNWRFQQVSDVNKLHRARNQ